MTAMKRPVEVVPDLRADGSGARRGVVWLAVVLLAGALLAACAEEPAEIVTSAGDSVATWDGGGLSLPDVESAFADARTPTCKRARRGGVDELLACYRELAESLVLERLVLAEIEDVDAVLGQLVGYEQLRHHAYVETFLLDLNDEIEIAIDEAEIERRFEADRMRYRRPGVVNLANIFRRHEDPSQPERTLEFLKTLKERFETGETFDALAREASHSENRQRGGQVGQVTEDELPDRLREVVFAMREGEISEPVRVRDGAVLLYVKARADAVEPSLTDARKRIRREILGERIQEGISKRVAGREPPAGSLVLEVDEVIVALEADEPEKLVLEIAGDGLSAGELRELGHLGTATVSELEEEEKERLAELYSREKERRLLALELIESGDSGLQQQAEEHLRREASSRFMDEWVEDAIDGLVREDQDAVRSYFEDNRHHYQSLLRFSLRVWDLPFGDDPPGQLRRMEDLREQLVAGEKDLTEAAEALGGTVEALGWRDVDGLPAEIPAKARKYLLDVGERGFSVPYQQDQALHLIELVEREEPRSLEIEEIEDQVRQDYINRFQQDLYRRISEDRLAGAGFVFLEDTARRLLVPEPEPEG